MYASDPAGGSTGARRGPVYASGPPSSTTARTPAFAYIRARRAAGCSIAHRHIQRARRQHAQHRRYLLRPLRQRHRDRIPRPDPLRCSSPATRSARAASSP